MNRYCFWGAFAALAVGGLSTAQTPSSGKADQVGKPTAPKDTEITPATEIGGKNLGSWAWAKKNDNDPGHRITAMQTVCLYGPHARKAAGNYLLLALSARESPVRHAAVTAIGIIGFEAPIDINRAVSELTRLLNDPQATVRAQSAMSLASFGPAGRAAIPTLIKYSLADPNSFEVRKAAALALGQVSFDKETGPNLTSQIALAKAAAWDDSAQVRMEAIRGLTYLGPPADLGDLVALRKQLDLTLKDPDKTVAIWARVCLMRVDPTQITDANLSVLARSLYDSDLQTRLNACQALGTIGEQAKSKVADVQSLLKNKKEDEQLLVGLAAWTLGQMGTAAYGAIPELEKIRQEHEIDAIADAAAEAIKKISGSKKSATSRASGPMQ